MKSYFKLVATTVAWILSRHNIRKTSGGISRNAVSSSHKKLNYSNPCPGKWRLAARHRRYQHSPATFYINGKARIYEVSDYRAFMKFNTEE